jgi:hypothetical protein
MAKMPEMGQVFADLGIRKAKSAAQLAAAGRCVAVSNQVP